MNFLKYKNIYIDLLPVFVPITTLIGFTNGLCTLSESTTQLDKFSSTIGFASLGIITGITFPISYPLLGLYVIFKNKNKK
jgi:hypothetical protein